MDSPDVSIQRFWHWFSANAEDLASASGISDSTVAELERYLFAIRKIDWEIGPGAESAHMFALSPRGVIENLAVTRLIISQAPVRSGWEFWPAKRRKQWNMIFDIEWDGITTRIDGRLWEVVVYRVVDGTFDLLLLPDQSLRLPLEALSYAATIIADGELGEEARMTSVKAIEIVASWESGPAKAARKLEVGLLHKIVVEKPRYQRLSDR